MCVVMSKATKRKYVRREAIEDEVKPTEDQMIVKVRVYSLFFSLEGWRRGGGEGSTSSTMLACSCSRSPVVVETISTK